MSALVGFMVVVLTVLVLVSAVLCVGHGLVLLSSLVGFISVGFPLLAAMVLALLVLAVTVLFVLVLGVVVLALGVASVYSLCWQLWCRLLCWLWCVLCVGVGSVCFCVCCAVLDHGMCFSCWASSLLGFSCWLPWCLLSLGWAVSVLPVLLLVVVVLA